MLVLIVLAGLLVVFLSRLDEIEIFEVLTLKVKLQRELTLAQQTTEQLRQLAVGFATPLISNMAVQGQWLGEIPYAERLKMVQDIRSSLRSVGVPENEVEYATTGWKRMSRLAICRAISEQIFQQSLQGEMEVYLCGELQKRLIASTAKASRAEIDEFLTKNNCGSISSELAFWLGELEYFDEHGKIKRSERLAF